MIRSPSSETETTIPFEDLLHCDPRCVGFEIWLFDGYRLFELGVAFDIGRDEFGALVRKFGFNVTRDGSTLVKNESIVILRNTSDVECPPETDDTHDIWNLAKRLLFEVFWGLVLTFRKVDGDKLVWDLFFLQDSSDPTSAGRHRRAVDFQDHFFTRLWCRWEFEASPSNYKLGECDNYLMLRSNIYGRKML